MSNSILLGKAAGINQSSRWLHVAECETDINSGLRRRFDLRKDMVSVQRNNRLTRTGFGLFANLQAKLQECVVDWSQMCFAAGKHCVDIALSGLQVQIRIPRLLALTLGASCQPPGSVSSELILIL